MTALATEITNGIDLVKLAEELGAGIRPPVEIWNDHGVRTREAAAKLIALPAFQAMLADAQRRWNSKENARARIREKSLIAIEQGLPALFEGLVNAKQPLNHRVEVVKILAKLGGIDAEVAAAGGAAAGAGVSITIDLSGNGADVAGGVGKPPIVVVSSAVDATVAEDEDEVENGADERVVEGPFTGEDAETYSKMRKFYTADSEIERELGALLTVEEEDDAE